MSNHISEELPRLLTGDASRDVVMAAAEHLRSCPDCQQELVSAVVAHASLTSAQRFAPEIVARPAAPQDGQSFLAPIDTGLHSVGPGEAASAGAPVPNFSRNDANESEAPELPNLSATFALIREEAAAKQVKSPKRRQRLLAVAAAAVVLAGGGVAIGEIATHHSATTSQQHVALAAYQDGTKSPFDLGSHAASATITGDKVLINATKLPHLSAQQQYEVWLTDAQRQHMVSIGYIDNHNTATLIVPPKVKLSSYTDIEVSVQPVGNSSYSQHSVVRGSYGA